ncbi:MAG: porin family protein [Bacteroidota bacterium]
MKKLLFTALLVIGFGMILNAQSIHLGAKGGVNFASITGDDADFDGRTGYHIGAVVELGLSEKFAIQPELIYSTQGADESVLDLNIDYLNLPVLAEIKLTEMFSVQAGPQFGFKVNEGDFEDLESFDLSGAFGLEVNISKFFAQARYNLGFTDVAEDVDARNSVFQISVGFWLL